MEHDKRARITVGNSRGEDQNGEAEPLFPRIAPLFAAMFLGLAIGAFAGFQDLAIGVTGPLLGTIAALQRPSSVFLAGALAALVGASVTLRSVTSEPEAKTIG